MTEKYFMKGYVVQTETTLIPDEPAKQTTIIETLHPTKDCLFIGSYDILLTSQCKMIIHKTGLEVLCEISEDKDGKLGIDHVYIDVEDL